MIELGSGPNLVFLPGFMGGGQDWLPVARRLSKQFTCLLVHWPTVEEQPVGRPQWTIQHYAKHLHKQLHHHLRQPFAVVGYSLGARVAMHFLLGKRKPQALIFEGGHPGLASENERDNRYRSDLQWAERFYREPMEAVLSDWYQQEVFEGMSDEDKQSCIKQRARLDGRTVSAQLSCCSLGQQEDMQPVLQDSEVPTLYLAGNEDKKYCAIGQALADKAPRMTFQSVSQCGHNCHISQPDFIARQLSSFLEEVYEPNESGAQLH